MVRWLVAVAIVSACQGHEASPRVETGSGSGSAKHEAAADARAPEPEVTDEGSAHVKLEEPETVDAGKQIADLGAVPAWQAVVDRTQYLARRGQHGVVFGTVGDAILVAGPAPVAIGDAGVGKLDAGLVASPYVWLVDDTEGNGALAIRILLGASGKQVKRGDRVALGGAWTLDEERHWYWTVTTATVLPPAPAPEPKDGAAAAPGHAIASGDLPGGSRPISLAKDGDVVYFTLAGAPPAIDGDGWPVADELGNPVYALLNLPGERPSYGGQDLRAPDERWQLRRGQTYALRIGHLHKHGDKPVTVNARTAPIRVK